VSIHASEPPRPSSAVRSDIGRPLLTGLLLALALAPSRAAAQHAPAPGPGTLFLHAERFEREDGSYGDVERGLLFVRQDRSDSGTGVLGVVFHRFPADDSADGGIPPIFGLHGGPGFGGLELEEPGYFEANVEPYTAFTDVVVVGQRGFAPSRPATRCEGVRAPMFGPAVPEEERADALREASRKCRAYWEDRGLALDGVNVREAASDVAEVARALLGGTEGPDHTYDMPSGVLDALRRVAADAEADPELGPRIPEGGLIAALRETIRRLEREPDRVTVEDPETGETRRAVITAAVLRTVADGYSSPPDSLHDMAGWPADVLHLHAGRYEEIAERALPDEGDDWRRMPDAAFFLLDCASGISAGRERELLADPAAEILGPPAWFYRVACPVWDVDLGDDFRTAFRTHVPTLVVHGDWDLSTPYRNAVELMLAFGNGRLVTVARGTHGALEEAMEASDAFREAVVGFLRTGDTSGVPERVELPPVDWVVPE
jgi:pimeloyl-ACP methyl ester carboxylesterase